MMRSAQNGRQSSMLKIATAIASLLLVAGAANALDCPSDKPQECSCSYTFSNGFTITSSMCCREDQACSCERFYNDAGTIIAVRAKCISVKDPSQVD